MIEELMSSLHARVGKALGRSESPGMGIIDSRSVGRPLIMSTQVEEWTETRK
ncbi:hypothetical protein [Porphyromonas pogonae]|uniref:hypothetical protein n=1 Tax=Porphyromonas pogonae TaxID=867595 RepID=UPI002E76E256|nr:hypothetical protein [Porphyromonas pogonae]